MNDRPTPEPEVGKVRFDDGTGSQPAPDVEGSELPDQHAPAAAPGAETTPSEADALSNDAVSPIEVELAEARESYARLAADFDNFRKRTARTRTDEVDRAAGAIVEGLLPVLDACEAALTQGQDEVRPLAEALVGALEKEGLRLLAPAGEVFDPTLHDAVMHEVADGGDGVATVVEVLRVGYVWRDSVLRPAMVKVRE